MTAKSVSYGATAFLDILGFGQRLQSARRIADIDEIAKLVKGIQNAFDYKNPQMRELQRGYRKTVLAFSDSVVINLPLDSEMMESMGRLDGLMSELTDMGVAQAHCVTQGLFLRGGVDLGWWYRRGATLVSNSLAVAYAMEGRANVPVIALSAELYEFLSQRPERRHYARDIEPVERYLQRYEGTDSRSGEPISFWFIDYVSIFAGQIGHTFTKQELLRWKASEPEERDRMMDDSRQENVDEWFALHARTIEHAHAVATTPGVKSKYEWLAGYHNRVAEKFITHPNGVCYLGRPA